jgi:hypothetical protein
VSKYENKIEQNGIFKQRLRPVHSCSDAVSFVLEQVTIKSCCQKAPIIIFDLRKWNGTQFSGAALGDPMVALKDTSGKRLPAGANPAIHWNTFLKVGSPW